MFYLLTGGSACGKSTYAESLVCRYGQPRIYIATMQPYGEESLAKIDRHRRMRAQKGFATIEAQTNIADVEVPADASVLLECICNLTSNEMFDAQGNMCDPRHKIVEGVLGLAQRCRNLVVVTNDVGSEFHDYDDLTPKYVDALGYINRELAAKADAVFELVCGIPIVMKGELPMVDGGEFAAADLEHPMGGASLVSYSSRAAGAAAQSAALQNARSEAV